MVRLLDSFFNHFTCNTYELWGQGDEFWMKMFEEDKDHPTINIHGDHNIERMYNEELAAYKGKLRISSLEGNYG